MHRPQVLHDLHTVCVQRLPPQIIAPRARSREHSPKSQFSRHHQFVHTEAKDLESHEYFQALELSLLQRGKKKMKTHLRVSRKPGPARSEPTPGLNPPGCNSVPYHSLCSARGERYPEMVPRENYESYKAGNPKPTKV